jgi:hypothetical protein
VRMVCPVMPRRLIAQPWLDRGCQIVCFYGIIYLSGTQTDTAAATLLCCSWLVPAARVCRGAIDGSTYVQPCDTGVEFYVETMFYLRDVMRLQRGDLCCYVLLR